jgi:hypothetical protein
MRRFESVAGGDKDGQVLRESALSAAPPLIAPREMMTRSVARCEPVCAAHLRA